MPELVFYRRGDEVLRFAFDKRIVLGRGEKCDVVLPDPDISRQHVALSFEGNTCLVEDLSGKGALVSGALVDKSQLKDGTDIALGHWRAIFREGVGSNTQGATEVGLHTEMQLRDPTAQKFQPAQIRIKQGLNESTHKLIGEQFSIGKEVGNDLVIDDKFISGRHLKATRKAGVFHVIDQHSTNGTFLNNVRIFEAEIPIGTGLRIGETQLFFEPLSSPVKEEAFEGIIGSDPAVRQLAELIQRVAPSSAAVAILGESGTGKELVAHAIHMRSDRANRPFIPVNCAAISKELIESELFGHEKGSFTGATNARKGAFEEADGGTLFLDEIGELPLDLQAKLLRALESGEIKRVGASKPSTVNVRIVAATNRDLLASAREGKFREDLYYRLCVVPLHLPPLRNRRSDILALAEHFVKMFAPRNQLVKFTARAMERLQAHHWPGNIRELKNVVHRALLLRKGPMIDVGDLSFDSEVNKDAGVDVPDVPAGMTLEQMLLKVERQIIENALRRFQNNRERVARELGVARSTLFKRLKEWGLTRQDEME